MGCSRTDPRCSADEQPLHAVEVSGFWIGETPVTVAAWKRYRVASSRPALMASDEFGRKLNESAGDDDVPAVGATWDEAQGFCKWAGLRLPTEAEWEFAARAGEEYSTYGPTAQISWNADNSGKKPIDSTETWRFDQSRFTKKLFSNGNAPKPVGKRQPNAWGLYDMLGNVWEWTADYYSPDYYSHSPAKDPLGPQTGAQRVLRGGAWDSLPADIRVSYRLTNPPGDRVNSYGFRCAGLLP